MQVVGAVLVEIEQAVSGQAPFANWREHPEHDPLQGVLKIVLLADAVPDQSPKNVIRKPTTPPIAVLNWAESHPFELLPQSGVPRSPDQGFELLHERTFVAVEDMRIDEASNFL